MLAIVFDLDGTLIDSAPDLHAAANRLLANEGYAELSLEMLTSFIGNGVPKLVERVAHAAQMDDSAENLARLTNEFVADYDQRSTELTRLYPSVSETIELLRSTGHRLGVCTNKPEEPARKILDAFGIGSKFDVVVGGDSLSVKKPNPEPLQKAMNDLNAANGIYVGDSEVDERTALAAGLPFAFFTKGYRKKPIDEFVCQGHFRDFRELLNLIDGLVGVEV